MSGTGLTGRLKIIRVVIALMVFVVAVIMFVDFGNYVPSVVAATLSGLQLIPALLNTTTLAWTAIVSALFVIVLTLLIGRVYCSTLCPLGTLQDLVIRFSTTRRRRRRFRYAAPMTRLHVGILVVTVLFFASNSLLLVVLLEPYSNFGRICSELGRPLVALTTNFAAALLGAVHLYSISPVQFPRVHPSVVVAPVLFLLFVVILSYRHGRLFCNLLCPTGAILRLLAPLAAFKIEIDPGACKHCALCEKVCKANCIDAETLHVDFASCVGCFNCMEVCPTVGVVYAGGWKRKRPESQSPVDQSRRTAVKNVALLVGSAISFPDSMVTQQQKPREIRKPVSPPGSRDVQRFNTLCTSCHLCVSVCPTQVLHPSTVEYGWSGVFQPRMEYSYGSCVYDCVACGQVCPTGAIRLLPLEEKKLTQIGEAKFVREDCIVFTKKTDCGACAEHCPTKAVRMVPYEGKLTIPEVTEDLCIGCGACEHPCPTKPLRAIYVEARSVHTVARKPEQKKLENTLQDGEFPF